MTIFEGGLFEAPEISERFNFVNTFAELPTTGISVGTVYQVLTTTGIIGFRKKAGFYRWTGSSWETADREQAELVLYDNTNSTLTSSNQKAVNDELDTKVNSKEPSFTKNTAFNKDFGSTSGTVAEGNDSRIIDSFQKSSNTLDDITAGATNKHFTVTDKAKLDGIETGATADQTDSEIKTAYESNANTNAFTDDEKTKLTGIEAGATGDQTDAEIKTAYENNANTNAFTDAEKAKLTGIETVTDYAKTLLDDNNASEARTTLGIPSVFNKNLIINGDFEIAQRGTSFISASTFNYTLDRWCYGKYGTMAQDVTQDSDVPTGAQARRYIPNSVLFDCTTAQPSIGAGDYSFMFQKIEGYNFQAIAQKTFTLSFWVKATKTGTYCISLRNSGFDRSYVAEYTINSSDTWEFKTITISASPSAGTWNYTNGMGIIVDFIIAAGSNFHTTPNAWQTGNFLSTSNQVNGVASVSDQFRLAGVQVEAGSVATEFEKRNIQQEIELCQRYFEKSYNINTIPGSVAGGAMWLNGAYADPYLAMTSIQFKVEKRATPAVTIYSPTGAINRVQSYSGDLTVRAADIGTHGIGRVYTSNTSSPITNSWRACHYIVDAEL